MHCDLLRSIVLLIYYFAASPISVANHQNRSAGTCESCWSSPKLRPKIRDIVRDSHSHSRCSTVSLLLRHLLHKGFISFPKHTETWMIYFSDHRYLSWSEESKCMWTRNNDGQTYPSSFCVFVSVFHSEISSFFAEFSLSFPIYCVHKLQIKLEHKPKLQKNSLKFLSLPHFFGYFCFSFLIII